MLQQTNDAEGKISGTLSMPFSFGASYLAPGGVRGGVAWGNECQHGNLKDQWEEEPDKYSNNRGLVLARAQNTSLLRQADGFTHTNTQTHTHRHSEPDLWWGVTSRPTKK